MTAREQAIEAGAQALAVKDQVCEVGEHGAARYDPQPLTKCPDCMAQVVVDAVMPIIRADEREQKMASADIAFLDAVDAREQLTRLQERVDSAIELMHTQRVLHQSMIAPTHPNAPVLIEVDRVLAILEGESDD
jgi:hypothetical protein